MLFEHIFNTEERKTRPIIGIVPSQQADADYTRICNGYPRAITAAGGAPLILPLVEEKHVYETLFPLVDGFLLSGGQDITPERYGETESSDKLSDLTPNSEEVECLILSYAYRYDVPVLGICRGMQMMNVYFGGTLYQDLADQFAPKRLDEGTDEADAVIRHQQKDHYDTPTHFVTIVRNSKLDHIFAKERLATNSMHHQGVRDLAPLLDAAAYGPDGLVEAIEVRDRSFMMGVQWHPEFFADNRGMGCLFTSLIMHASEARAAGRTGLQLVPESAANDDDERF